MLSDCSTLLSISLILLSIFIYKVLRKKRFSAKVGWGGGGTGEAIPHFKELFPPGHRHCGAWHRRAQEHLRRMPPQFGDQGGGCVCVLGEEALLTRSDKTAHLHWLGWPNGQYASGGQIPPVTKLRWHFSSKSLPSPPAPNQKTPFPNGRGSWGNKWRPTTYQFH